MLEKTAGEVPQKEALVLGAQRITYGELNEASSKMANALIELGTKKGDHVAILMSHSPEWVINYFGVVKCGGVAVPLSSMLKTAELGPLLRDSDARILITEEEFSHMLSSVLPNIPLLKHVIEVGTDSYTEMTANSSSTAPAIDIEGEDKATI